MARHTCLLIALLGVAASALNAQSEGNASNPPPSPPSGEFVPPKQAPSPAPAPVPPARPLAPDRPVGPEEPPFPPGRWKEHMRERLRDVPPERRDQLLRNAERWERLPPEERAQLRRTFEQRRQRMLEEAEAAMRQLGLNLTGPRRNEFVKRYAEERRALEAEVRRAADAERDRRMPALLEKLRTEFGSERSLEETD